MAAQLMVFGLTLLALPMAWSGSKELAGWGCGVLAVGYAPMLYAGARIQRQMDSRQRRLHINHRAIFFLVLYLADIVGFAMTFSGQQHHVDVALRSAIVIGTLSGMLTTLVLGWWKTKQADKNRPDPADIPDED